LNFTTYQALVASRNNDMLIDMPESIMLCGTILQIETSNVNDFVR